MKNPSVTHPSPTILKTTAAKSTSDFWDKMEFNRYGIMVIAILLQSCLGAIAVMYTLHSESPQDFALFLTVVAVGVTANALCIAQAPIKMLTWASGASVAISILTILIKLL
ncbi:MAG: hypothetical protein MK081_01385 [Flavobacteriales bacterium]|uniref:hypothetical protein n=1 Tax=Sanyastnella coralliicola TaxID=3069118 RepID=UPI0027BA0071|nr:hypothetical protein [Longitalea sp. SCSIO 12813]MCH2197407.1 hypothetical protein [Flavobacteriales bacterium]